MKIKLLIMSLVATTLISCGGDDAEPSPTPLVPAETYIHGDLTASVANGVTDAQTGTILATNPNSDEIDFNEITVVGTYGTFTLSNAESDDPDVEADPAGEWTYILDVTNPDVIALSNSNDSIQEPAITITALDGTTSEFTMTITGTDPTFEGLEATIAYDDEEILEGTIVVTDLNDNEGDLVADSGNSIYGTYTISANGDWTYDLDNSNAMVLALFDDNPDTSNSLTDEITITSDDDTEATLTILITELSGQARTAVLINGDMQTHPTDPTNDNDLVDAWTINPDNTFDGDGSDSIYTFWENTALEAWVSDPNNNGGSGTTDKASTSGTDAQSAGGTSDRSYKMDSSGERAYQPFEVETNVSYSISAFVKSESTPITDVEGTFYILSEEPQDETNLESIALAKYEVIATEINTWQQIEFSFISTNSFSFAQETVDANPNDILTSVSQQFVILYFVPTNTVTSDNEVFLTDITITTNGFAIINDAVIQNADMETYPTDPGNDSDLVDAWTINPDNTFDGDGSNSIYTFWENTALEAWVSDPNNNGGSGTTDKASSSGTDAQSAGGTSGRSYKMDSSGERAYQPFEIQDSIYYTISAYIKSETTPITDVEGTFYVLSKEPEDETDLDSIALVKYEVLATEVNAWKEISFGFRAYSSFSFPQETVDANADDILTSVNQKFVILYFIPTNTVTSSNEVFITDIVITTGETAPAPLELQ